DYQALRFFYQAPDGIRDYHVTGVQTCALPIFQKRAALGVRPRVVIPVFETRRAKQLRRRLCIEHAVLPDVQGRRVEPKAVQVHRSEERRVGKEVSIAEGVRADKKWEDDESVAE